LASLLSPSPIDCLARFGLDHELAPVVASVLDSYNGFLELLSENGNRQRLESLAYENASGDELFGKFRDLSRNLQASLNELFFTSNTDLTKLAQEHGLF
jgi:hypothetical protein